mmetsp:Transcript_8338/g.20595  ORF Transcript_8338/g.20595 Transcript_8338/m.20595 type:complete len:242 (-) Transcript_8338:10767-11492(-)
MTCDHVLAISRWDVLVTRRSRQGPGTTRWFLRKIGKRCRPRSALNSASRSRSPNSLVSFEDVNVGAHLSTTSGEPQMDSVICLAKATLMTCVAVTSSLRFMRCTIATTCRQSGATERHPLFPTLPRCAVGATLRPIRIVLLSAYLGSKLGRMKSDAKNLAIVWSFHGPVGSELPPVFPRTVVLLLRNHTPGTPLLTLSSPTPFNFNASWASRSTRLRWEIEPSARSVRLRGSCRRPSRACR